MIKIKDYIFNKDIIEYIVKENNKLWVFFYNSESLPKEIENVTFDDIEWNYENFNDCKKLEEVILARDVRIKELETRNKNQEKLLREQSEVIIPKNIEQHNEIVDLNVRIKELENKINKAIEYIGNGNLGIPRKTREKFIKILKGEENESN